MLSFSNLKELHYNLFSVSFLIYAEYYVDRRNFQFFQVQFHQIALFLKKVFLLFQVTVENFLRVLTGRVPPSTPRSKRLLSDDRSNILIYMTGISELKICS